jgi:hypothetical protein
MDTAIIAAMRKIITIIAHPSKTWKETQKETSKPTKIIQKQI